MQSNQENRRHGDGFKKDREDGNKNKKKNISLAELRKENPKKGEKHEKHGKSGKSERRPFKGGNRKHRDNRDRLPKDPAARKERLDKEMERYWIKGGHKELGKSLQLV